MKTVILLPHRMRHKFDSVRVAFVRQSQVAVIYSDWPTCIRDIKATQPQSFIVTADWRDDKWTAKDIVSIVRDMWANLPIIVIMPKPHDHEMFLKRGATLTLNAPIPWEAVAMMIENMRKTMASAEFAPVYDDGYLSIDLNTKEVRINGEYVSLGQSMWKMLEYLYRMSPHTVTRSTLAEIVLGRSDFSARNTITRYIGRLRERIEPNPHDPVYIVNVTGRGYAFRGIKERQDLPYEDV